jgi:phosphatidylglycerophosphatase GEP4
MTSWFNVSGTLSALRLLRDPSLCLPQVTVPTFNHLPIPLTVPGSKATETGGPDIRAVVIDKDNCFALPHSNTIYPGYRDKFAELRKAYPGSKLLIVSNTAGTTTGDPDESQAKLLEQNTGVKVLRHGTKKPGCHEEIMHYLKSQPDSKVTKPSQVAIVGDRLLTDVMMANMMGSYAFWVKDGVAEDGSAPNFVR